MGLPPVTAEYGSTLQGVQSTYRYSRAGDGKTRVDSGNLSVISNPATAQTIVLDHVKKTATIQPSPAPAPPSPAMPQMPALSPPGVPAQSQAPGVQVEDLGKSVLQGHEVEGKRFVIPQFVPPKPPSLQMPGVPKTPQVPGMPAGAPPTPQVPGMPASAPQAPQLPGMPAGVPKIPQIPGMPAVPKIPQLPGMPAGAPKPPQMAGMPAAPAAPQAPQPAVTGEVWNSTKMSVPMLTKMSGSFGQLTQVCHSAVPGEPHPSAFQIPQGYKVAGAVLKV